MKKIISLILALVLCAALAAPVFAEDDFEYEFKIDKIIYNSEISATSENGDFILNSYFVESDGSTTPGKLEWYGGNDRYIVTITPTHNDIIIVGIQTEISPNFDIGRGSLYDVGISSGTKQCYGNRQLSVVYINNTSFAFKGGNAAVQFGDITVNYIQCKPGSAAWNMFLGIDDTASTLSNGYPEIVYAIGGLAVGVVGTLLITKKRKPAVASGANSGDEE